MDNILKNKSFSIFKGFGKEQKNKKIKQVRFQNLRTTSNKLHRLIETISKSNSCK
jgi:hypothetical protein